MSNTRLQMFWALAVNPSKDKPSIGYCLLFT